MPYANIANAAGKTHRLYYVDSGPVPGSNDYHTIFFHHGSCFNNVIWKRILPLAAKHNLRFVAPNRRDYLNSDKYSEEEVQELKAGKNIFLENLAVETSNFWLWFIDEHNVPKLSEDKKTGGVTIVGWSMGNSTSLSPFGQTDAVGPEVYEKLEAYIKTLVIYDSPHHPLGLILPDHYNPFTDPEYLPNREAYRQHVLRYLSTYYNHAPQIMTTATLEGMDPRKIGDRPSVNNMTEEEIKLGIQFYDVMRSDIALQDYSLVLPLLRKQADKALWDEEVVARVMPGLKVAFCSGNASNWRCAWTYGSALDLHRKLTNEGKKIRPFKFMIFPGMNHFGHWDHPEKFVELLLEAIEYQN